jgi:methionyl-tRNA synthetase
MAKYITTTLPYVNADPHIGFALEIIEADVLARTWRAAGEEVFFSTGTDEHGQKIFQKAAAEGTPVQEYVDHFSGEVRKLKEALGLSYDSFIRTTDEAHTQAAQEMWKRCQWRGDIYKKTYSGLYCVGDEAFVKEADLVNGLCPNHPVPPIAVEEENYFFRFSLYQTALVEYLEREDSIVPEWRRQEALNFVRNGLEDFSISREKKRMEWGIAVPGDDTQVMYVWFDALTNYISTLGWPADEKGLFKRFWDNGDTLQLAGKDQVRFQSLMWQAMLMSADLPVTDHIFYHGFITSNGQKMSKSIGNVISPYEIVEKYGTDATRCMLMRHVHPTDDTDITRERLDEWYTADLVNGIGNLTARIMKLAESNLETPVALVHTDTSIDAHYLAAITEFRFNDALDYVFHMIAQSDAHMTEREPFKKVKSEDPATVEEGKRDIAELVRNLAKIAAHLSAIMPETSVAVLDAIARNKKPENLFPRLVIT